MEAVKSLNVQRSRTSRGMGIGTVAWWMRELGKPSPAPAAAMSAGKRWARISGDPAKSRAGREGGGGVRSTA